MNVWSVWIITFKKETFQSNHDILGLRKARASQSQKQDVEGKNDDGFLAQTLKRNINSEPITREREKSK